MRFRTAFADFTAAFREGWAPLRKVMPRLLRSMAVSGGILLIGLGAIVLGGARQGLASRGLIVLGEGLLIGGALLALVASLRAWIDLFRETGVWRNRS